MTDVGALVAWNQLDGVGRIQLDDGEVLRVGQSAFGRHRPVEGARCEVLATAPHALGGSRATRVTILESPRPAPQPAAVVELHEAMMRQSGDQRDYQRWIAGMPPTSDLTAWLHERIRRSTCFRGAPVEIDRLVESHEVLRGARAAKALHGIDVASIDAAQKPAMLASIEEQLRAWKGKLGSPVDQLRIHRVGRRLGLSDLEMADPPALRGEPFATTEGLDADWQRRVALWAEAAGGTRALALERLGARDAGAPVTWAPLDLDALRDVALEHEIRSDTVFPRELAAMLAVGAGVRLGDAWLIAPAAEWASDDDGLRIGSGSTDQGSLTLISGKGPLLGWRVLDRDDDGATLHSFPGLAALFDALLGLAPG